MQNEGGSRIIVALDFQSIPEAVDLAKKLEDQVWGFKIGLGLIHGVGGGHLSVGAIEGSSENIFYDAKLSDVPTQVGDAIRSLAPLGLKMITVHCLGGREMMAFAKQVSMEEAPKYGKKPPLLLGVTIPTSLGYWKLVAMEEIRHYDYPLTFTAEAITRVQREAIEQKVAKLALMAKEAGFDGVVTSGREAKVIRRVCGKDFLIVATGIRLSGHDTHDQERVASPREAIEAGADLLVIGRDITEAENPIEVLGQCNDEVAKACAEKGSV